MKRRILSMLLLAVLLVTSIPVMAVSALDGEVANTTDYYKWYVGAEKGPKATGEDVTLIGNFTAFANEDNSNGEIYATTKTSSNQKWYNKVEGGADISMYNGNSGTWKSAENAAANGGGLSVRMTRSNVNNCGDRATRMELKGSWFNNPNLLIETSAVYYGYTGNNTIAGDDNETFRFGVLRGMVWPLTCEHTSMRLISTWRAQQSGWSDAYARNLNLTQACGVTGTSIENFAPAGLTLYMQKTTTVEEDTTYISYAVDYNNGLVKNQPNQSDTGVSYPADSGDRIEASAHDELYDKINTAVPDGAFTTKRDSKITLYQRSAFDVYTIRVYAGTLTQAEKEYNHLIDLLGFYQVAIPAAMTSDVLMSLAPDFMDTIFVYDDAPASGKDGFSTVKASLQGALDSLTKVTVMDEAEENVLFEAYISGDSYRLPTAIAGQPVLAYYSDYEGDYVYPDTTVAVDESITLIAYLAGEDVITTDAAAETRVFVDDTDGLTKLGVRFGATVNYTAFMNKLAEVNSDATVRNQGMLITPKAYVDAAGEFSVGALDAYAAANGSAAGAYIAISAADFYDKTDAAAYTLKGTLMEFSEATLEKNPTFAVIAFIELDLDGDNISDTIVYGEYDEAACFNVQSVVQATYDALYNTNATDERLPLYKELLDKFAPAAE